MNWQSDCFLKFVKNHVDLTATEVVDADLSQNMKSKHQEGKIKELINERLHQVVDMTSGRLWPSISICSQWKRNVDISTYKVYLQTQTRSKWGQRDVRHAGLQVHKCVLHLWLSTSFFLFSVRAFFHAIYKKSLYSPYKPLWRSSLHQRQSQFVRCQSVFTNRPKTVPSSRQRKRQEPNL